MASSGSIGQLNSQNLSLTRNVQGSHWISSKGQLTCSSTQLVVPSHVAESRHCLGRLGICKIVRKPPERHQGVLIGVQQTRSGVGKGFFRSKKYSALNPFLQNLAAHHSSKTQHAFSSPNKAYRRPSALALASAKTIDASADESAVEQTPTEPSPEPPTRRTTHFENQPPPIYPIAEEESAGPSGHPGFIFFSQDSRVGTVSFNPQATVQGTPASEQELGEEAVMGLSQNLPPKRLLLMAVLAGTLWTSLMGIRVFGKGARVAAGAVSLVWLGIVIGISFLEAWVKFRAPLITKAVAVDVGRHVFAAKSYVEKLLYLALVALLADAGVRPWGPPFVVPVLMAVVLLQWEWLEPGLEQRARWTIAQAPSEDLPASKASVQAAIAESVIQPVPGRDIHEIFGALEVVKMLVLVSLAVWALKGRL